MKNAFISLFVFMFLSVNLFAAFSVEQEKNAGAQANKDVVKMFVPTKDSNKQKQLEEFGKKLVKYCDRHDYEYEFHVGTFTGKEGEGYNMNAFAIPGGYVYFGEDLWDIMDENEREGIIAHEITHVDRKHSLKQAEKNQLTGLGIVAVMTIFKVKGNLANIGATLLSTIMSNNYSISDEREADKKGTELLIKAGLNPCGVLNSMRKLYRMNGATNDKIPDFLMDHPKTKSRIKYLKEFLEKKNIPIPEEKIQYIYPKDMLGRISYAEYENKKYTKLKMTLSDGKSVAVGDVVYIDYFVWDSKYENLVPVTYGSAKIASVDGKEVKLQFLENFTKKSGEITEDYIISKNKIETDKKSQ